jgi:hypothetical protein
MQFLNVARFERRAFGPTKLLLSQKTSPALIYSDVDVRRLCMLETELLCIKVRQCLPEINSNKESFFKVEATASHRVE